MVAVYYNVIVAIGDLVYTCHELPVAFGTCLNYSVGCCAESALETIENNSGIDLMLASARNCNAISINLTSCDSLLRVAWELVGIRIKNVVNHTAVGTVDGDEVVFRSAVHGEVVGLHSAGHGYHVD